MPFISSSGGTESSVPGRTATRSGPAGGRDRADVRGRPSRARTTCRRHTCRARRPAPPGSPPSVVGRRDLLARPLAQPRPCSPATRSPAPSRPAASHSFGSAGVESGHLEGRLRVARRVDQRGDVPAGRQDEPALPAEQLGGAVAGLPRAEVVGDPGGDVGVDGHRGEVDRRAEHRRLARLGQRVADGDVDEVAVQAPRSSGWCRRSRRGCRSSAAACPAGSC